METSVFVMKMFLCKLKQERWVIFQKWHMRALLAWVNEWISLRNRDLVYNFNHIILRISSLESGLASSVIADQSPREGLRGRSLLDADWGPGGSVRT